ncbi:MAG: peptidase M28, partial [Sphingobacteriales bacterium]
MRKQLTVITALVISFASVHAQDATIEKIREQGLTQSKVMEYAFRLTDANDSRLTNSPGYFRAANWAKNELTKLGLVNAALEPWGDFGKGWDLKKSYIAMTTPYYRPLIGFPKTWTKGTGGLKNAEIIVIKAADSAALEAYKGKLKGKIIMLHRTDTLKPTYKPDAERWSDEDLSKMAAAKMDTSRRRGGPSRNVVGSMPITTRIRKLAEAEGAIAQLS